MPLSEGRISEAEKKKDIRRYPAVIEWTRTEVTSDLKQDGRSRGLEERSRRSMDLLFRSLLYERVSSRNDAVTVQLRSELTTDTMALLFAVIVILVTTAMSLPPVIRIDKLYQQLTLEQSKTLEKELDTVEDRKNGVGSNR
ncbi:hypothetical protein HZH66_009058 [Vespula vulgaris]|uniref:Uncharacterized protein n=1 Tax=Vespula vulgaris TaxID=7454 RepID=A0A834N1I6_VESVU|nr:hypothetical protein HZH66_009058 [Vespula vulgaris]